MLLPGPECELAATAAALAGPDAPLTEAERAISESGDRPRPYRLRHLRLAIESGKDPLGSAFRQLRPPEVHREQGAVYTPRPIVEAMVNWAAGKTPPKRVVDPGAGSGRFLLAAGKAFPDADLIAVEIDPLAALTLRANAAALGLTDRLTVLVDDYRAISLPEIGGATLFLGNPPYVRHHAIAPELERLVRGRRRCPRLGCEQACGSACAFLSQDPHACQARRLRCLHYVSRVARRELWRPRAQTACQRPRRHGPACHFSGGHAIC